MSFDVANPPVEPPSDCQHRLLWRLARALWEAHRPDSAGFCVVSGCWHTNQRDPCRLAQLAQEGMQTACGKTTPASPPWIAVTRKRLAAMDIEPGDAAAEALWRHRRARGTRR